MAPEYAIIFMDKLEREFLSTQTRKPLIWWRYIDDIFFIWPHSREELYSFIEALNSFHPTIKFTCSENNNRIDFLDTTVIKSESGHLITTLFTKPTDANMYLHYSSDHPKHQKDSIPLSQAIRIRRICNNIADYDTRTIEMKEKFLNGEYPRTIVENAISKARSLNRTDLLKNRGETSTKTTIPFITTYNQTTKKIKPIIETRSSILNRTPDTNIFNQMKFMVTLRRPRSIRDLLIKSDILRNEAHKGCQPCGKRCYLCRMMQNTQTVTSTVNNYTINISSSINCETLSVVYVIECKKCRKQYVGQTGNNLRERFRGHLQDINTNNQQNPVSKHFTTEGHSKADVIVTGILTTPRNINIRLRSEEAVIYKLSSLEPFGLSRKCKYKDNTQKTTRYKD